MFMDRTLKEMLENPVIAEIAPDAIRRWDLREEAFYNKTLQEIADEMGWRSLERGFTRLYEAAKQVITPHISAAARHVRNAAREKLVPIIDPNIFAICASSFESCCCFERSWL